MRSVVRQFYVRPTARLELVVLSLLLCYVGGAAMFYLHCVYRGEHGPALSDWSHWLLDSSVGFVLLAPVSFVLLPLSWWLVRRPGTLGGRPVGCPADVAVFAGLFTLVTFPGPLFHERLVGAGTPIANLATSTFGENAAVASRMLQRVPPPLLDESVLQVVTGFPVYLACTWLAFTCSLWLSRRTGVTFALGRRAEATR